jgi:cyclopropane-fatty-acyl-phospholipid synthase
MLIQPREERRERDMSRNSIVPECQAPGIRILPAGLTGALTRVIRKVVLSQLAKIERGRITLIEGSERFEFGDGDEVWSTIVVCDPTFYADIAFGGSIGAAEAYMSGFWSSDDLTALIRIIIMNSKTLLEMEGGLAKITAPLHRLLHTWRKNTKDGSRRNITAHYDLGNDFYKLWLDETMTYSCSIFERDNASLSEAAIAKYDRICRKLQLGPRDNIIEIGTGWGGFAIHAAKTYGCRITTTTISRQQYDWAKARVTEQGLSGRVELLFEDYRDLKGKFDKLVSIEMIEAVGHHFLDDYFKTCSKLLKDDGTMALQAITITDQVYEAHLRSPDFIKRYIFPGSFVPSINAIVRAVATATDMKLFHLEDITPHYVRTLRAWRENFFAKIEEVRKLGYNESFIRMWEYYLRYCEAGFAERYIGDAQMIFTKPGCRMESILPHLGPCEH